jgi:putative ABC transport system permease protein
MKYLPLVWAGLWRKRARTVLTLLCVVVAFGLFGMLHGFTAALGGIVDAMSESRLRSMSRVNIMEALPLAHAQRMATVPGVKGVSYYNFFAGYYQDTRNSVQVGAIDIASFAAIYPDIELEPQYVEAMQRTRNGALVGEDLAEQRGWKIGDRIPLGSAVWRRKDGEESWDFEIVGSYRSPTGRVPTSELWINYAYFDEARAGGNGTVTLYLIGIDDSSRAAEVSEKIDALFANSMFETQTQSEKEWVSAQIAQIGNLEFFVNAITVAVMFALLFVTGNTMMQSVRERIPELAVLKTYGFSNGAVVGLVIAESVLLCSVAAAIGIGIAAVISPPLYREFGAGGLNLPLSVVGMGLGLAAVFAVVSALLPALRAQRLSIVDALAGR